MDTCSDQKSLNPLIDGDFLIYRSGAGADSQAKEEYGQDYKEQDYTAWALGNIKVSINTILDQFPNRAYYRLFIGGKLNYRNLCARHQPYKGTRTAAKPKYYHELRDYVVSRFGAEYSEGREADDEVSILQYAAKDRSTCIVAYDKDLRNTPGNHLNPIKKEFSYITKKEADLNFLGQVLTGDTTDAIAGIPGLGPKTRDKILQQCNYDLKNVKAEIDRQYKKHYGSRWEEVLHEMCTLLWIQRQDWINYDGGKIERPTVELATS